MQIGVDSIGFCPSLPNSLFFCPGTLNLNLSELSTFNLATTTQSQPQLHVDPSRTRTRTHTHTHKNPAETMPRQRSMGGGRSAPSRPTVPARSSTSPQSQQQTRPAASYAAPATQAPHQAPPAAAQAPTSSGGGLFGQMASTAAYVVLPDRAIPLPTDSGSRMSPIGMEKTWRRKRERNADVVT